MRWLSELGYQTWTLSIALLLACFLLTNKRYRWIYILYQTLPRDVKAIYRALRGVYRIKCMSRNQDTIPKILSKIARKTPNKVAFYYEDEAWTFQQLEDLSNKVANYFIAHGYQKGDTISLLLENRPEYVALWIGLSKAGIVIAFINTNLKSGPLHHCISVANSKALIFGSDYINVVDGIKWKLEGMELFLFKTSEVDSAALEAVDLKNQIQNQSVAPPTERMSQTSPRDKAIFIYTSGTTGLPKAATITHTRYFATATGLNTFSNLKESDIFYNPLPLYHSAGGMVGVGQSICYGLTVVLRKKFSASNFWVDCNKYKCTAANYIGETCRYLLLAHKGGPVIHGVKKMMGNGLRKEIWTDFANTFNIQEIYEFYGSTEGNANLINIDSKVGAVGFLPVYGIPFYPLAIIKCDDENREPLRNNDGFCVRCKDNEVGILIGKINKKSVISDFSGYADKKETNRKVINDVFKKGDSYFNSGDLMVKDDFGYIYFKDRTGDTFRWKGENVATTEVETVANEIIGHKDVVIYGVQVPGSEGRAGMIAVADPGRTLNTDELAKGLSSHLPPYAIPLFLRIMDALPITGTFKIRKVELQKDGFDMSVIKDPLYFFDAKKTAYIPLENVYENIVNGKLRL